VAHSGIDVESAFERLQKNLEVRMTGWQVKERAKRDEKALAPDRLLRGV
jgi:hypothetical protein